MIKILIKSPYRFKDTANESNTFFYSEYVEVKTLPRIGEHVVLDIQSKSRVLKVVRIEHLSFSTETVTIITEPFNNKLHAHE